LARSIPTDREAVVPLEILDAPGLKLGDRIIYDIDIEGTVVLGRADDPLLTPFVLFTE